MDKITIGTIAKPQGIRGEIKISPLTDDLLRFKELKSVYVQDTLYAVTGCRLAGGVFLTLEGVDNRDKAELLRNKDIKVDRKDAVKLPKDRYFIVDIIGCKVMIDDQEIGTIKDILQYGSADIYVIKEKSGKESMIPAIDRIIEGVDIEQKVVRLDREAYEDLALYED